jgi:hypothetical protein
MTFLLGRFRALAKTLSAVRFSVKPRLHDRSDMMEEKVPAAIGPLSFPV